MIGRRGFITGLVSLVAAPAIVRVASIMPVRPMVWGLDFGKEPAIAAFDPETLEMVELHAVPPRWFDDSDFSHVERCG